MDKKSLNHSTWASDRLLSCQLKKTLLSIEKSYNQVLKHYDITLPHAQTLAYINEFQGCIQTNLAQAIKKDKTTVTRLIDILVEKDLVVRTLDNQDRRAIQLHLSEKGKKTIVVIHDTFHTQEETIRSLVSHQEYAICMQTLQNVEENFNM